MDLRNLARFGSTIHHPKGFNPTGKETQRKETVVYSQELKVKLGMVV